MLKEENNQVKQRQLNWLQACSAFHQNPTDPISGEKFADFVEAGWIKRKALPKKKGDELRKKADVMLPATHTRFHQNINERCLTPGTTQHLAGD